MTGRCRDGHDSAELDYCSVCGGAMPVPGTAPSTASHAVDPAPSGSASSASASACPSCGEPRADADARFCEVCRYDFVKQHAGRPTLKSAAPVSMQTTLPDAAVPSAFAPSRWRIIVMVDATLDIDPDPAAPCPKDRPIDTVPVDKDELLVGRRDDRRDIRPDLALDDPGTSRRHCKLVRGPDDTLWLQDLASTNGSRLNGTEVAAGSKSPLKDGDEVMIGRWTRIKLRGAL